MTLKAITVNQPWAGLIAAGFCDIINLGYPIQYVGPLLIISGARPEPELDYIRGSVFRKHKIEIPERLKYGGALAIGQAVRTVTYRFNNWFKGPYGLVLEDVRPIKFFPIKGRAHLFTVDETTRKKIEATESHLCLSF